MSCPQDRPLHTATSTYIHLGGDVTRNTAVAVGVSVGIPLGSGIIRLILGGLQFLFVLFWFFF